MARSVPRSFKHTPCGRTHGFPEIQPVAGFSSITTLLWINGSATPTCRFSRTAPPAVRQRDRSGAPLDYLEFGVYEGDSIRMWIELNKNPASRFVGFDSFEGLPEAWDTAMGAGSFDLGGQVRRSMIRGFPSGDWFNDTISALSENPSLPGRVWPPMSTFDLFSSSLWKRQLDSIAVPGTHRWRQFFSALHEFRAFRDYLSAYRRKLRALGCTGDTAGRVAFIYE